MKKLFYCIFLLSFLEAKNIAQAIKESTDDYISYDFGINALSEYSIYSEFGDNNENLMSISGAYLGGQVNAEFRIYYTAFVLDSGILKGAGTKYDGHLQDINGNLTPFKTDSKDWYYFFNLGLKQYLFVHDKYNIYLNVLFGRRYLNNIIQTSNSYLREQVYYYGSFGGGGEYFIKNNISMIFGFDYRQIISAYNITHLKPDGYKKPYMVFDQNGGNGLKTQLALKYTAQNGLNYKLGLYYELWLIDKSEEIWIRTANNIITFYEPKNQTHTIGAFVSIGF